MQADYPRQRAVAEAAANRGDNACGCPMPITTILACESPTIRITGAIDMPLAYELIDEMDLLHGYYQFRTIALHIDSPGGNADALHYIIQSLAAWRKGDERVLRTVGLNEICSAAAMLLSFGTVGHRSAHRYSRLLYHPVRTMFPSNSMQTYTQLKMTGKRLDEWDQKFFDLMAEHTEKLRDCGTGAAYRKKLKKLFLQEKFISAAEACEMHLIDSVCP